MTEAGPAHCRQCHPWAGRSGVFSEEARESKLPRSVPPWPMQVLAGAPALVSHGDGLFSDKWKLTLSSPRLLLVMVFLTATESKLKVSGTNTV